MSPTPTELMEIYLTEVVARGQLDRIEEIAHPDMVDEANQAFGGPPGRAGLVAHVKGFRRHVHDLELGIDQIVGDASRVMAQWRFRGIHAGPWLGREPTGRPVSGTVFSFFEVDAGLIRRYRLWLCAEFPERVVFDSSNPTS